ERVLVLRAFRELRGAVDRGVDVPPERSRQLVNRAEDVTVTEVVADDHQVDVAAGFIGGLGDRSVDERCPNVGCDRLERFTQRLRETDGLQDDVPQFRVERRVRVCLVVLLIADAAGDNEAAVFESCEFALCRSRTRTGIPNQLRGVEAAVRLAEKYTQDALLRLGEQRIREALPSTSIGSESRAQYGYHHA